MDFGPEIEFENGKNPENENKTIPQIKALDSMLTSAEGYLFGENGNKPVKESTEEKNTNASDSPSSVLDFSGFASSFVSQVQQVTAKTGDFINKERQQAEQFLNEKRILEKTKSLTSTTQSWVGKQWENLELKLEQFDDTPGTGGEVVVIDGKEYIMNTSGKLDAKSEDKKSNDKQQVEEEEEDEITKLLAKGLPQTNNVNLKPLEEDLGLESDDESSEHLIKKEYDRETIERVRQAAKPVDIVAVGDTFIEIPHRSQNSSPNLNEYKGNGNGSDFENKIDKFADDIESEFDKRFGKVSQKAEDLLERGWNNVQNWIGSNNEESIPESYINFHPKTFEEVCSDIRTFTLDPKTNNVEKTRFERFLETSWSEDKPDIKQKSLDSAKTLLEKNEKALEYFQLLVIDAKEYQEKKKQEKLDEETRILEEQKEKELKEKELKDQQQSTGFGFSWFIDSALKTFNEETGMHITKESIADSIKSGLNGSLIQKPKKIEYEPITIDEFLCRFRFRCIQTERRALLASNGIMQNSNSSSKTSLSTLSQINTPNNIINTESSLTQNNKKDINSKLINKPDSSNESRNIDNNVTPQKKPISSASTTNLNSPQSTQNQLTPTNNKSNVNSSINSSPTSKLKPLKPLKSLSASPQSSVGSPSNNNKNINNVNVTPTKSIVTAKIEENKKDDIDGWGDWE